MGEEVAGIVVTRGPTSEQELIDHCGSQIARYKIPRPRVLHAEAAAQRRR
jgi:hypothetical protein